MNRSSEAALWGLLAGAPLVVGAALGYWINLPRRLIAAVMAFGSGVLISALSFELMDEAYALAGFLPGAIGCFVGALAFTIPNLLLSRRGAKQRKRSGPQQPSEHENAGSGLAIAIGALLDGLPESVAIGLSLLRSDRVSVATVAAIFLSNFPEGLSSAAGMRRAGRSARYVIGLWLGIVIACSGAAWLGYAALADLPASWRAATNAMAAGGILAMVAETMIPEAFEETPEYTGLITVAGFLVAFFLSKQA